MTNLLCMVIAVVSEKLFLLWLIFLQMTSGSSVPSTRLGWTPARVSDDPRWACASYSWLSSGVMLPWTPVSVHGLKSMLSVLLHFEPLPFQWGQMRSWGGSGKVSGWRIGSVWQGCLTWLSDTERMIRAEVGEGEVGVRTQVNGRRAREVTRSHPLPVFVRLSSALPGWSCLILLQFCNNIRLPLILLGRQGLLPSRQYWWKRKFSKGYYPD